jgi:hypothetical protein
MYLALPSSSTTSCLWGNHENIRFWAHKFDLVSLHNTVCCKPFYYSWGYCVEVCNRIIFKNSIKPKQNVLQFKIAKYTLVIWSLTTNISLNLKCAKYNGLILPSFYSNCVLCRLFFNPRIINWRYCITLINTTCAKIINVITTTLRLFRNYIIL